jgi:hypothetical protein
MTDARRIKILFLAASPGSMGQVNAGREAREIRETLRATAHRDSIELVERFAVRPGDLQQTFFEVRPHIVHFSGHGTTEEEMTRAAPSRWGRECWPISSASTRTRSASSS